MSTSKVRKGATVKKPAQRDANTTLSDNSVPTNAMRDSSVTSPKIGPLAVTPEKIASSSVEYVLKHAQNYIINGHMDISQRGTSFAAIATATYSLDRWKYNKNGAMVHTITQDTDVPTLAESGYLFQKSLRLNLTTPDTSLAAGDFCNITQTIEGYNWARVAQRTFTLSFWVKATTAGTYCVAFQNSGLDRSYVAEYTISLANTWEKKTITVTASPSAGTWDYTSGAGLHVRWTLASGTTFQTTAGSWQTGTFSATTNQANGTNTGATDFRITGVMLNVGDIAAPFAPHAGSFQEELDVCQRYFWRLTGGAGNKYFGTGYFDTTLLVVGMIAFPTTMRTTPTISYNTATDFVLTRAGTSTASGQSPVTISSVTNETALISITSQSASTVGYGSVMGVISSSYIQADAEL